LAAALRKQLQFYVDEASNYADQAEFYATEAIAAAGNGGYLYHPRTKKRFKYTSRDGAAIMAAAPQIFLDPENGNDSWDGNYGYRQGTSTSGPKRTRAGVEAHAAFIANASSESGVTIAIRASDTEWRDGFDYYDPNSRNSNRRIKYVNLCVYGGSTRKISCLDVISKGSITAHATIANAYQISVTHDMHTGGTSQFRIFVDGQPSLLRVSTQAATSTAGTYWYAAAPTAGGTTVIVFHPYANSDPRSDASVYEVTMRDYAFGGGDGCSVEGIHAYANGSNNGSISIYNYGEVRRCLAEEGTKHNWLMGPGGEAFDTISVNSQDSRNYSTDAMGNQFVLFGSVGAGLSGSLTRCAGIVDPSAYSYASADAGGSTTSWIYGHCGDGNIDTLTLADCWESGTQNYSSGEFLNVVLIDHTYFGGTSSGTIGMWAAVGTGNITVRRALAVGNYNRLFSLNGSGDFDAEDVVAVTSNTAPTFIYGGGSGSRQRVKNSIFHAAGSAVQYDIWPLAADEVIDISNCIFSNFYIGYNFTVNVNPASAAIDHNFYAFNGTGGSQFGTWKGTSYSTFGAWKTGTGFDTNSTCLTANPASGATWLSGVLPDSVTCDVRIDPASAAYTLMTARPDQEWINTKLAPPRTRDAALAYVKNTAPATPVLVAP
jgi:hypothetical protein